MPKKDMVRKIYRTVCANLRITNDEEYNQTLDVLEEMIKLYFLKHNGNKKKLFMIQVSDSDDYLQSTGFILAYDKEDAVNEFCKSKKFTQLQYHGFYVSNLVDIEDAINNKILIL